MYKNKLKYASSDITEEEFQTRSRRDLKARLASTVEVKSFMLQREKGLLTTDSG